MTKKFFAGQQVRVKPSNDKINEQFIGLTGVIRSNEPSGMFDYYIKFDKPEFTQGAYAFYEDELEAVPVELAGNTQQDKLDLTKELVETIRGISESRRRSNLAVAYDIARWLLKNYTLTRKDGN